MYSKIYCCLPYAAASARGPVGPCSRMTRELGSHREIQIEAIDQPVHVRQTVATLKPSLQFLAIEKETSPERLPLSFTRTIEAKATEQRRELVVRLANMKSIFYEATLRIILGQRLLGARG